MDFRSEKVQALFQDEFDYIHKELNDRVNEISHGNSDILSEVRKRKIRVIEKE